MKHLGQRYVQYFNRTYGRTGTLWEGRFRSSLVQREGYALTCQRYIELNPVRAKMVQHPRDYAWSSYRVAAEQAFSSVIAPHPEYLALGDLPHERAVRYARLFPRELSPDELCQIRLAANGGFALGSPDFIRTLSTLTGRRVERLRGQTTRRGNAR